MTPQNRYESVIEGAAYCGAVYRANPDIFVELYLHIKLRLFQRIVLIMMFWSTVFALIACRGIGKTFISAIYCVTRCVLYPGTVCCISSGTRGQGILVLEKILQELVPNSPELKAEIKSSKINGTIAEITFWNTSRIKVVTASDNSRGNRCNVLLLDEFRMISKSTIDNVLDKFLNYRRMPPYTELNAKERNKEYDKEKNITMYLSSAYFKESWAYTKCMDIYETMFSGKRKHFICGFPYQLSIKEGLLDKERVEDDLADSEFNEISWLMEMCAEFYGSGEEAFFDYTTLSNARKIRYPMLPNKLSSKLTNSIDIKILPKRNGEIRILSADIALMPSKKTKNDATAIFVNRIIPTKSGRYTSNIVFPDIYEGLRTDNQALIIRKLFDEFDCDYIVLDTIGIGLGVYDELAKDIIDPDTGEIYPALSCCNNQEMAARCVSLDAKKVIWSIKATSQFNSDCAVRLREGFRSGRIRLLENEYEAIETLGKLKGYKSLNPPEQLQLRMPYIQTTLLVDELTKLLHEENNGKIRLFERSGMRKDRYSSLSYNYYVALQLEAKMAKKNRLNTDGSNMFIIKPPNYRKNNRKVGIATSAKGNKRKFERWL